MALPKLKVMSVTDAAADRIRSIMANADRPIEAIRVGVKNGGCAGMAYTIEYEEKIRPGDDVVDEKGVKIVVDPKALMFLLGTEMDFQSGTLASQFVFNNPNQTSACGAASLWRLRRRLVRARTRTPDPYFSFADRIMKPGM